MSLIGHYSDFSLIGHVVMNMEFKNLSISIKTKRVVRIWKISTKNDITFTAETSIPRNLEI